MTSPFASIERFRVGLTLLLTLDLAAALLLGAFQLGRCWDHSNSDDDCAFAVGVMDRQDASAGAGGALEQGDAQALHLPRIRIIDNGVELPRPRVAGEPFVTVDLHVTRNAVFTYLGCSEAERQLTGEWPACMSCVRAGGVFAWTSGEAAGSCRGLE